MKHKYILKRVICIFTFLSSGFIFAQDGIGTTTPDPDSILDISSSNKGLLIPRVALTSLGSSALLSNNVPGMIIYNTTSGSGLAPGFYFNDGTTWQKPTISNIGDIKYSFNPADHNGWYLLNGRTINTLSANAQVNAAAMGFSGNLPNAADRFLKAKEGSEVLGATGGSTAIVVSQANMHILS